MMRHNMVATDKDGSPVWNKEDGFWIIEFPNVPFNEWLKISCEILESERNIVFTCLTVCGASQERIDKYRELNGKVKCKSKPIMIWNDGEVTIRRLEVNIATLFAAVDEGLLTQSIFNKIMSCLNSCPERLPVLFRYPVFGWAEKPYVFTIYNMLNAKELRVQYDENRQNADITICGIEKELQDSYRDILRSCHFDDYRIDDVASSLMLINICNRLDILNVLKEKNLLTQQIVDNITLSLKNHKYIPIRSAPHYRRGIEFKVNVQSNEEHTFIQDAWHIIDDAHSFITDELDKLDVAERKLHLFWVSEMVKNAFDSYFAQGVKQGDVFIMKVLVEKVDDNICIKIKDNAGGFLGKNKGERFWVYGGDITYQDKSCKAATPFFGGQRKGLWLFNHEVKEMGGSLDLKNRKEAGASVEVTFRLKV